MLTLLHEYSPRVEHFILPLLQPNDVSAKTGFNINEAMLELVREIVRTREREGFQDLADHNNGYGEGSGHPVQAKTKGYQKSPTPPGPYPMEQEEDMEMEKGCCCTIM